MANTATVTIDRPTAAPVVTPVIQPMKVTPDDPVLDLLVKSRNLIADRRRWVAGHMYLSRVGLDCDRGLATRMCAMGALEMALYGPQHWGEDPAWNATAGYKAQVALDAAALSVCGEASIVHVNDEPTLGHAAVLRCYDAAITARGG